MPNRRKSNTVGSRQQRRSMLRRRPGHEATYTVIQVGRREGVDGQEHSTGWHARMRSRGGMPGKAAGQHQSNDWSVSNHIQQGGGKASGRWEK